MNSRVYRSRERRRQAGLKRVEVFVPIEKADQLKAYAAQLREGSQSEAVQEARKLIAKADAAAHANRFRLFETEIRRP